MITTRDGFANSNKRLLEVDNLTGSNGIEIVKNTAGDKVEVKLSNSGFTIGDTNYQTITINPYGEDSTAHISLNYPSSEVYTDITPYDIRFVADGRISHGLTSSNVKTIAGKSIYGSGDITYYAHNINVLIGEGISADFSFQIISSSDLKVNSLANLRTLLKSDNRIVPAWGSCDMVLTSAGFVQAVSRVNVYYIRVDYLKTGDPSLVSKTWTTLTSSDGVRFIDRIETL